MMNNYVELVKSILLEAKKTKPVEVSDDKKETKPTVHRKKEIKDVEIISQAEMERLAKISAKYDIKKALSNKHFHKDYTDLNPNEKKKIRAEMKKPIIKKKLDILIDKKIKERSDKQKEEIEAQKKRKLKQIKKSKEEKKDE